MKSSFLAVAFATTLTAWPLAAHAQYTNPYTGTTWNNPMSNYLDTVIMGNNRMSDLIMQQSINRSVLKRSMARSKAKSKTGRTSSRAASHAARTAPRGAKTMRAIPAKSSRRVPVAVPVPSTPVDDPFQNAVRATSFKFVASPLVSQKLAQLLIPDVEKRPKAAQIFGWCLQSARADFRKNTSANLPVDNVARALAFFIISSRGLALTRNGEKIGQRVPDITIAQSNALRTQIALALSGDAGFQAKSDRQKQEMYEMLLIMPAYAETVYGIGLQEHNVESQEVARGLARDSLKRLLNMKPERIRFTEAGLQLK